jgi:hypothetical protein
MRSLIWSAVLVHLKGPAVAFHAVRRRQVEPDHVADLVYQQRVGGDLEAVRAPWLQPECPPDAVHAGRRDPRPPGQFPLGPVRGALRGLLQRPDHYLLHLGVGDGARHPRRGSSPGPSRRLARERARHVLTVPRLTPSRAATARLPPPCAQASTIGARKARPCAVLRRLAQFSNVRRLSSDNTSGANLGSGIYPRRGPCHYRTSDLERNTTQVVMGVLKTGSLGDLSRPSASAAWLIAERRTAAAGGIGALAG